MKNYYTLKELKKFPVERLLLILSQDIWSDARQFFNPRLSQKIYKQRREEQINIIKIICPGIPNEQIIQIIDGDNVKFL